METLIVTGKRYTNAKGEKLVDKNGTPYCVLEFSTPDTKYARSNATGKMMVLAVASVSVGGYAAWEVSNLASLKGKPDFGWNLEIGQEVQGTIAKRRVKPYFIADAPDAKKPGPITQDGKTGRMVETASVVSFANSDAPEELELDIQEQFRRKNHELADGSSKIQVDTMNHPTTEVGDGKKVDEQALTAA